MKKSFSSRGISTFLVIAMVFTLIPVFSIPISANPNTGDDGTTNWDFIVPVTHQTIVPSGYIGIYTAQDLDDVRNNLNGNYILMSDIDLATWGNWTPIGDYYSAFSGAFDGNGYVIRNIRINISHENNSNTYAGLFGKYNGVPICNLGISETSINIYISASFAPWLYVGGVIGESASTIQNCYVTGKISVSSPDNISSMGAIGGIVGRITLNSYIEVNNCYNAAEVVMPTSHSNVGGIIGAGYASCSITNCQNEGEVEGAKVGGIIGDASSTNVTFSITNCNNRGTIKGTVNGSFSSYAGGIAGSLNAYNSSISYCYNEGEIHAEAFDMGDSYAGGIAGCGFSIFNCNNEGKVSASNEKPFLNSSSFAYAGGIVGTGSSISNCNNTGDVISISSESSSCVGGIAGVFYIGDQNIETHTIYNCSNSGNLNSSALMGDSYVGGIAGYFDSWVTSQTILISESNNVGVITSIAEKVVYAGGIGGYCPPFSSSSSFYNCNNIGEINASSKSNNAYVGGIGGCINVSTINCENSANISVLSEISSVYVAGIIGDSHYPISGCTNNGNVNVMAGTDIYVGGIAGYGSGLGKIIDSDNNGDIKARANSTVYAGGIIGDTRKEISDSKNTGDLDVASETSVVYSGGIIGRTDSPITYCTNEGEVITSAVTSYSGGIAGYGVTVDNCKSAGKVTTVDTTSYIGGIMGYGTMIKNSFAKSNLSGTIVGGILGSASTITNIENCTSESNISGFIIGGILGNADNSNVTIENCTSEGNISIADNANETTYIGGMVGYVDTGSEITFKPECVYLDVTLNPIGGGTGTIIGLENVHAISDTIITLTESIYTTSNIGDEITISGTVKSSTFTATSNNLKWECSDPSAVTFGDMSISWLIDETVISIPVTCNKEGAFTITVTAEDDGATAQCEIEVGMSLVFEEQEYTLNYGQTLELKGRLTAYSYDVNQDLISWNSDASDVFDFGDRGLIASDSFNGKIDTLYINIIGKKIGIHSLTISTLSGAETTIIINVVPWGEVIYDPSMLLEGNTVPFSVTLHSDKINSLFSGINYECANPSISISYGSNTSGVDWVTWSNNITFNASGIYSISIIADGGYTESKFNSDINIKIASWTEYMQSLTKSFESSYSSYLNTLQSELRKQINAMSSSQKNRDSILLQVSSGINLEVEGTSVMPPRMNSVVQRALLDAFVDSSAFKNAVGDFSKEVKSKDINKMAISIVNEVMKRVNFEKIKFEKTYGNRYKVSVAGIYSTGLFGETHIIEVRIVDLYPPKGETQMPGGWSGVYIVTNNGMDAAVEDFMMQMYEIGNQVGVIALQETLSAINPLKGLGKNITDALNDILKGSGFGDFNTFAGSCLNYYNYLSQVFNPGIDILTWAGGVENAANKFMLGDDTGISHVMSSAKKTVENWVDVTAEVARARLYGGDHSMANVNRYMTTYYLQVFKCPVDIEVYDGGGNFLGAIVDNVVTQFSSEITLVVNGDSKIVIAPVGLLINLKIIPTGYGVLNYTVDRYENDIATERINFFSIPLEIGETLSVDFEPVIEMNDISHLRITMEQSEIEPSNAFEFDNPVEYIIQTTALSGGFVSPTETYLSGDAATIVAVPEEGYLFWGWYIGDELVSMNELYQFTVTEDVSLVAHFVVDDTEEVLAIWAFIDEGGMVEGDGFHPIESEVTLIATPNTGYSFDAWYENDIEITGIGATYTFTATTNRTLEARFTLTPQTDAEAVAADKALLTWTSIRNTNTAQNSIIATLASLPTTGENGSNIAWSSSNPSVISNTGLVTRPSYIEGNATVTLTATVSKGMATDTVTFTLTVIAFPTDMTDEDRVTADKLAITWDSIKGTNTNLNGVTANLGFLSTTGANGSTITWSSSDPAVVSDTGAVARPLNGTGNINVTLTATITYSNVSETVVFTLTVIELPATTISIQIISSEGGAVSGSGTFTPEAQVTLTATPYSGYSFGGWYENNIKVSNNTTYIFTATANRTLEARFTWNSGGYIPPYTPPSDNGTSGGSTTSGISNSDTTTNNSPAEKPVVKINGISINYIVDTKGNVILTPTQAQMKKITDNTKDGILTIDIGNLTGVTSISLDFNMSWIPKTIKSIKVFDKAFGSFEIKYVTLAKFNGKITLVLKKGSLITDIIVNGKSAPVTDYANPMIVSIPYTLKSGELASYIVMIDKTTGKVIPRSYYKGGYVYATVYSTGHFEPAYVKPKTFTDTSGTWSNESVKYMNAHGVINGVTETTFEPNSKVTRAQYITMIVRLLNLTGIDYSDTEAFSDVDKKDPYYTVIMQARTLGITNGIGDNKFGSNLNITLEDMYTMTYRAMKQFGMAKDFDKTISLDSYSDGNKVSAYAVEAMQNLLQNGIVKSESSLSPKVTASRAITSLLMYRLLLSDK